MPQVNDQPPFRIVDLSTNATGGYATRLLAAYGAEIIKIEPPGSGDPTRAVGPFPGDRPILTAVRYRSSSMLTSRA